MTKTEEIVYATAFATAHIMVAFTVKTATADDALRLAQQAATTAVLGYRVTLDEGSSPPAASEGEAEN